MMEIASAIIAPGTQFIRRVSRGTRVKPSAGRMSRFLSARIVRTSKKRLIDKLTEAVARATKAEVNVPQISILIRPRKAASLSALQQ